MPRPVSIAAHLLAAITLASAFLLPATGSPVAAAQADDNRPALQKVLNNQRRSINIPGMSATVIFGDDSRWSGASGKSNLAKGTAATPRTPFVVGSITKTFVAALIVQLAADGVVSLDDPLSRWLPSYPRADTYSLRALLSHTSGVHNYFEHPDYNRLVFGRPTYAWTAEQVLSTFQRAPYFAPGTGFHYSNTGYVLLGRVAEQATGVPLGQLLTERFGQPLGLARTSFQGAATPPAGSSRGYLLTRSGFREITDTTGYRPTRSAATVAWAAGDGVATADDIATWMRALYGGSILPADSLTDMLDFRRYPGNGRYGLGVQTRTWDGRRMYGHTGSLRGYVASAWHLPAENVTVVVLTNRGRINATKIVDTLLARALGEAPVSPAAPTEVPATPLRGDSHTVAWIAVASAAAAVYVGRLRY